MKVFISADIEGVNGITSWNETFLNNPHYPRFQKQLIDEVSMAAKAAKAAGAKEIVIKDAHDSALNLIHSELPEYTTLIRGWTGQPASMMAGLDESFNAVIFIGYHSPSCSDGNTLSHTMNTNLIYVKINGEIASEFLINAYYASLLNVPVAFASGDLQLMHDINKINSHIITVPTKVGMHGGTLSKHPNVTNQQIYEGVLKSLTQIDLSKNIVTLPNKFTLEVKYRNHYDAYSKSFFPGCKLIWTDTVYFESNNYYDCLIAMKFIL